MQDDQDDQDDARCMDAQVARHKAHSMQSQSQNLRVRDIRLTTANNIDMTMRAETTT